nr:MAG TPA: hypothetical protein [Bacteriophage sp.]
MRRCAAQPKGCHYFYLHSKYTATLEKSQV